jgi:hypothetical protein
MRRVSDEGEGETDLYIFSPVDKESKTLQATQFLDNQISQSVLIFQPYFTIGQKARHPHEIIRRRAEDLT